MSNTAIQQAIEESMDDIKARDDALMMEVVGVAQAIDHLRKALDQVEACLDTRDFFKASSLGYNDVATEFIFFAADAWSFAISGRCKKTNWSLILLFAPVWVFMKKLPPLLMTLCNRQKR